MTARSRGALAALLGVAFMVALSLPGMSRQAVLLVSNGGQLAAAVAAAVACGIAARRSDAHERLTWALLAGGTGGWAFGQTVWTYYEVIRGVEVPFPSLADVGFLLLPLLAAPALLFWQGVSARASGHGRDLLDGAIIAASMLVLSWSTTLGTVVAAGGEGWLAVILSLAYPLGDIVLATVVLLTLGRVGAGDRSALLLVAGGVGGLAVADSAYVFLVATGSYSSGDLVTSGWVLGFLLIAAGARTATPPAHQQHRRGHSEVGSPSTVTAPSRLSMLLPYPALLAAGATICYQLATSPATIEFDLSLGVLLVVLVLARQFLAMSENARLVHELQAARDQLQHQALHDPLTGLANRALFGDRLEHALAQRRGSVTLLYCDLDDFKQVNDEFGHHTGDSLLCAVARRLVDCVRPGDTVARLGGDEFAILLEDPAGSGEPGRQVQQVADRIVSSIQEPCELSSDKAPGHQVVRTTVSVGVAQHHNAGATTPRSHLRALPEAAMVTGEQLLMWADSAMYRAKAAGKGQVVAAEQPTPSVAVGG